MEEVFALSKNIFDAIYFISRNYVRPLLENTPARNAIETAARCRKPATSTQTQTQTLLSRQSSMNAEKNR
jgi:hypothetical protein